MKTILHVIDSMESGGAETVFVELADRLRARGYRTLAVVPGEGWSYKELMRRNISPIIISAKGSFNLQLLKELTKIIRHENVKLIQSHLLGSNVYCGLAGFLTHVPVVATFHGMVDVNPNERFRSIKFRAMEAGVKAYVVVSGRLRDAIHKNRLLNPAKTHVIYNGINASRYDKSSSRDLRDRLHLPENARLIGSLGNLHPAKGYDYLIRAARDVITQHPNAHFVIGGERKSELIDQLKAMAVTERVSDHIHFVGFVNSIDFLSQLDVFLLPSISEGFSIVTLEALATGLPSVITKCGGPEEIVNNAVDALLVEVSDAAAIAQGVNALLSSPELCAKLTQNAKDAVASRFTLDAMVSSYIELYERHS